ncbi:hypothetical protein GY21_16120 [Cryobacterium roopkundense]|uniref:Transglycosylase SLT domain-containing protein n=1 Tax=Cryobacterium roopkundense TaxID=1001240 RepID=A0A099J1N2_9MICO|nr:hypothetical protein [Cryobacterium roopkundense]KGJ72339.1 hypothetical protein GY21_16120 [Cryobacterium roopkundense]MBB5642649.1 hypothetical protein [Cryobacterium roopkundense]
MGGLGRVMRGATLAAFVASTLVSGVSAGAEEYPSWAEVDAARSSEAATAAEVARIESALDGLQARAAELGDEAVTQTALHADTQTRHTEASAQQTLLTAQADAASALSEASGARLGTLGAQLYRSGGSGLSLGVLFDGEHADDLLFRLGTMTRLTDQAGRLTEQADAERNAAEALTAQAEVATRERDLLQVEAAAALAATRTAQRAADDEVAVKRAASATLYAQLASLKNSSAEAERQYRTGVAAHQQYVEQQRQSAALAAVQAAAPTAQPGVPSPPPSSGVVDRGGAQQLAAAQVAARGWGVGELSCLVSLWQRESGWRVNAHNASSGAYGIPQSLPGSKMATAGDDWQTNPATQISWGLGYIASRYGTPCGAWAHSEAKNWY